MKTATTKQVEALAFEKLSDWTITKSMYKRHEMGIVYTLATLGWTLVFMHLLLKLTQ